MLYVILCYDSEDVVESWTPEQDSAAIRVATEFMELHRKHWPEFEGESEVRPMFDPGMGP